MLTFVHAIYCAYLYHEATWTTKNIIFGRSYKNHMYVFSYDPDLSVHMFLIWSVRYDTHMILNTYDTHMITRWLYNIYLVYSQG